MEKGFDWAWNVVPQLSAYQLFIAIVSGYVAFIGNVSREKNEKVDGQVFKPLHRKMGPDLPVDNPNF